MPDPMPDLPPDVLSPDRSYISVSRSAADRLAAEFGIAHEDFRAIRASVVAACRDAAVIPGSVRTQTAFLADATVWGQAVVLICVVQAGTPRSDDGQTVMVKGVMTRERAAELLRSKDGPGGDPARVVLDAESVEHFRSVCRPLIELLKAALGFAGDPIVTARSVVGDFFNLPPSAGSREAGWDEDAWRRFAAAVPFPVVPGDRCVAVARRLAGDTP